MPALPPIRFDEEVYDKQFPKLPEPAREALREFLKRLQNNPRDTSIYAGAQSNSDGLYGFPFCEGWVVYWHLDVDKEAATILRHGVRYIYVVGIQGTP